MEDNQTKKCGKCGIDKPLRSFNKQKTGRLGLHNHCRECQKQVKVEWNQAHKQEQLEYASRPNVKERHRNLRTKRYWSNKTLREKELEKNRIRRRSPEAKQKAKLQREKWMAIPHNKISHYLRGRTRKAIGYGKASASTEKLLGCSYEQVKVHIEQRFEDGMSWDNYGEWHIDHIIPCDFFDLTNQEHQRMCFNYRNLRPMWAIENIAKSNRITIDNIEEHLNDLRLVITPNQVS